VLQVRAGNPSPGGNRTLRNNKRRQLLMVAQLLSSLYSARTLAGVMNSSRKFWREM
jgi:hypothetical protein